MMVTTVPLIEDFGFSVDTLLSLRIFFGFSRKVAKNRKDANLSLDSRQFYNMQLAYQSPQTSGVHSPTTKESTSLSRKS
jgi:hypothetical protein